MLNETLFAFPIDFLKNFIHLTQNLIATGLTRSELYAMPFWELYERLDYLNEKNS